MTENTAEEGLNSLKRQVIVSLREDYEHAQKIIQELTKKLVMKEVELLRYKKVIEDLRQASKRNVEEELEFVASYVAEFIEKEMKR
jgi:signal recognition particle GTPase